MLRWIRSVGRFLYFVLSTVAGLIWFLWRILWGTPKEVAGADVRKWWLSHIPKRIGIRMTCIGEPYQGPCLYVGNHTAYIDPVMVLMFVNAYVVAKAEVRKWPLVGLGASVIGTIFVQRDNKTSRLQTVQAIRDALKNGQSILVFPEGTTFEGPGTLPFRPRSFEAAEQAGVPVQPITIIFDDPLVPYVGDHTFIPHFFRLFTLKEIHGTVHFGPLLYGENTCARAQAWINETLGVHTTLLVNDEFAQKA